MRFDSHDQWFRVGLLLSLAGSFLLALDYFVHIRGLAILGAALIFPLLFLSAVAIVVGIPYGMWVRWTERRKR